MSLDLGELSGRIGLDIAPLKRDLASGKTALRGHVDDAEQAGEDAGRSFSEGWGDKAKEGAKVAAAAVAGAMVYGIHQGLQREASSDRLAAQLGLDPKQQARAGRIAGRLYADAYGESIDEVNTALGATMTSFDGMSRGNSRQLENLTARALDYATAFEVDVARGIQVAGQLVNTGLAKNAREAFDLITTGSQRVPAAVREDLLDASDEYGQFFATLGFDGREAFSILVDASSKGMYGIDKAGDAIKEFTIRSTDMSTASTDAYKAIGLDAEDMADKILRGGDDAQDAFGRIIDGLLSIESPSKRANTAIALFGTPLEDLNASEIPAFLRGLRDGSREMDGFRGSAKRMGDTLNDNATAKVTAFKRKMENQLIGFLAEEAIPFLEDDLFPALSGIGDALDNVPSWAIKGSVGGFFGLIAAGKLGSLASSLRGLPGLGGGKGGGLGGVVSKATPVPVFVTNPGFESGLPDAPDGKPSPKSAGFLASLGKFGAVLSGPGAALGLTMHGLDRAGDLPEREANRRKAIVTTSPFGVTGQIALPSVEDYDYLPKAARAALAQTAEEFRQADIPTELKTHIALNGVPESMREARDLVKQYNLTPEVKRTLFEMVGYDKLRGQIRWINQNLDYASRDRRTAITIAYANAGHQTLGGLQEKAGGGTVTRGVPYLVGEREPELFVPDTSGRIFNQQQLAQAAALQDRPQAQVPAPKAMFNIEQVVAHDYHDFLTQSTRMHQQANLGGIPAGARP